MHKHTLQPTDNPANLVARPHATRRTALMAVAARGTIAKTDVRQKFAQTGSTVVERGPEEFNALVAAEVARWVPVIRACGATLE